MREALAHGPSYPFGLVIPPRPERYFTIDGFASFYDAGEAYSYSQTLEKYHNRKFPVFVNINI